MRKIYQTIIDRGHGNCMQASFASLFSDDLENVPNFIELPNYDIIPALTKYAESKGYKFDGILYNKKWENLCDPRMNVFTKTKIYRNRTLSHLKRYDGVDGLFYAGVCSPKNFTWDDPSFHAVIIDKNCNIVHDPNPNYNNILSYPFSKLIDFNGIIDAYLFNKIN